MTSITSLYHRTSVEFDKEFDPSTASIRERLCWVVKQDRACREKFLEAVKISKAQHKESITVIMEPTPKKMDIDFHDFTMLGLQKLAEKNNIIIPNRCNKEQLIALLEESNERGELHL